MNILTNEFTMTLPLGQDIALGKKKVEAAYIEHVLKQCRYNQSKTALALGVSRGCLRMKLAEYFGDAYVGTRY